MIWSEVQITTTPEAEDAVAEAFYEAGAGGVAIESSVDVDNLWGNPLIGYVEDEILNRPENTSVVRGYFPVDAKSDERIQKILIKIAKLPEFGLDPGSGELRIMEVKDEDWENSWKKYFVPTHVTPDVVVVPSWEQYIPETGEKTIMMDPGMAFGTGTHETTKLCARKLERYIQEDTSVLDVGTGTGILSIIAAKLGAHPVVAVDVDPVAVKVAQENIAKNGLSDQIEVFESNLLDSVEGIRPDVIVANILPEPVIKLAPKAAEILDENGHLIVSGIIKDSLAEVIEALEENSFRIVETDSMGEWCVITADKL